MAISLGVNSGFVTTAPTSDPAGTNSTIDAYSWVTKHTSPATATRITEIGFWCDTASQAANFEVGLYAADGASGEAGTRLYVDNSNAKGTGAGWKVVAVDWAIDPNTDYWLGIQVDNVTTTTYGNLAASGGNGYDTRSSQSTLPNPFGGGSLADADGMAAIYALYKSDYEIELTESFNISDDIQTNNTGGGGGGGGSHSHKKTIKINIG